MKKASKAFLKEIRELIRDKKKRDESGLFVAEGLKLVRDICTKGVVPVSILASGESARHAGNKSFISAMTGICPVALVKDDREFDRISSLRHSQGIMAVFKKPEAAVMPERERIIVLCDGIQDPSNLGAIMRTMAAFGVKYMLYTDKTADIYNPKAVRASSGMIVDVKALRCRISDLRALKKKGYRLFVSRAQKKDGMDVNRMETASGPWILVFGSEGKGVSGKIHDIADGFFYIPIRRAAESLNVSAAAAISLYVLTTRQGAS